MEISDYTCIKNIHDFTVNEKKVIKLRYNEESIKHSLQDIAVMLELSKSRVADIDGEIKRKIWRYKAKHFKI